MAETDEVEQLKRRARRRLVGAAAIVLFLVIVPPMLMDLEPRPVNSNLSVEIPPPGAARIDARSAGSSAAGAKDAGGKDGTRESGASGRDGAGSDTAAAAPEVPAAPRGVPAPAVAPPTEAAPARAAPEPAVASSGTYFIPLGTFAGRDNAKQLVQRAEQLGFKVYSEEVRTAEGERTRVRAGPYPSQDAAERARSALKAAGFEAAAVRRGDKRG
jgi:DedD protein